MIPDSHFLEQFWMATGAHLWQTTLVLMPLLVLAKVMRNAPARLVNGLWSIGLVKLCLPLALFVPMARSVLLPLLRLVFPFDFGTAGASAWLGRASAILDPAIFSVDGPPARPGLTAGFLTALTVAWIVGAVYFGLRRTHRGRSAKPAALVAVEAAPEGVRTRLSVALEASTIDESVIRIAPGSGMPAVIGLLRRRVLVSERMVRELTAGELRAVLLHENEHRRRYDPLRSVVHRCALAAFFYYPMAWMILRRLASSCEMACDEAAVGGGIQPAVYARALARTLNLGLLPSPSPAAIGRRRPSLLHERLNRLSRDRRYVAMTRHRLALAAAVGIVAAVSLIPLPPVARSDHGEKVAQATPAPVGKPEAIEAEVPAPAPAPEAAGEDLVKPPRVVLESYVAPQYPEAARKNGIEGKVVLDVTVGEDGTVGKITVTEGVPEWPSLEESAQEAVRQWKFEPATEGGEPVEMSVAIPVMFGLDASKQTAEADTAPELVNESVIKPEYPEDARKDGVSGKVLLDVVIKKDGSPGKISVKQGIPGYPSFGEKAVEAVSQWKFKPATKDGEPIEMITAIPLMFRLDDAAKPVSDPGSE